MPPTPPNWRSLCWVGRMQDGRWCVYANADPSCHIWLTSACGWIEAYGTPRSESTLGVFATEQEARDYLSKAEPPPGVVYEAPAGVALPSLRDRFAMHALSGQLASFTNADTVRAQLGFNRDPYEAAAVSAYRYADAMLAERSKDQSP